MDKIIDKENVITESTNTLTVKQDGHNITFKYLVSDSQDNWVVQYNKTSDIEYVPSADRWKHATCLIKLCTDQSSKDKHIFNGFHKLIEMVSDRFVKDPKTKVTKHNMPKVKKDSNDNEKGPETAKKFKRVPFKFDIDQIIKERKAKALLKQRIEKQNVEMKVVDDLFQKAVNRFNSYGNNTVPDLPKLGYVVFDSSKYNTNFRKNSDSDVSKSCLQQLYLMSIEENELEAVIYFHKLIDANWCPVFNDIQNILFNWGTDMDTLINKPLLKRQINNERKIILHCFELVLNFLNQSIQKNYNKFRVDDLLTIAKFAATISLDHHYGQRMMNFLKELFSTCVENSFHDEDDTGISNFSEELFSNYKENRLLKMVVDLFLPIRGKVMKKMYTYWAFKLYKSLIGKTDDLNPFPTNLNIWFVQDQTNMNYFRQIPQKTLHRLISLMEHVVVVVDLYENEKKVQEMYEFFYSLVNRKGGLLTSTARIIDKIDQWRLHLFRLHVNRIKVFL